jgi:hypothetical protein
MKKKLVSTAKMKAGKAKKPIGKAQTGKMLPEVTKKATSLRPMEIALGDDRKMSIDTVGYKSPTRMRNETYNYTVSDKSGKVIRQDKLKSDPSTGRREDIVSNMARDLESGKLKRPTFKSGGKITAKVTNMKKAKNGTVQDKKTTDTKETKAVNPGITMKASSVFTPSRFSKELKFKKSEPVDFSYKPAAKKVEAKPVKVKKTRIEKVEDRAENKIKRVENRTENKVKRIKDRIEDRAGRDVKRAAIGAAKANVKAVRKSFKK